MHPTRFLFVVLMALHANPSLGQTIKNTSGSTQKYYFKCIGNTETQLTFVEDKKKKTFVQEIWDFKMPLRGPDTYSLGTFRKIGKKFVYQKSSRKFSIDLLTGVVTRDGKKTGTNCTKLTYDLVNEGRDRAQNSTGEFWARTSGWSDARFIKLGTLASAQEICQLFDHKIFNNLSRYGYLLDSVNRNLRWEGIEAGSLWLEKKLKTKGMKEVSRGFGLIDNMQLQAEGNLAQCLEKKSETNPKFYSTLRRYFLGYLSKERCFQKRFEVKKTVDDKGNIITRRLPTKNDRGEGCVYFGYNSGDISYWGSSTFLLLVLWKEAHPVLKTILTNGDKALSIRIAEYKNKRQIEAKARQKRKLETEERQKKVDAAWLAYTGRKKSLLEEVYNFASTGNLQGLKYQYWIEKPKCVLTNGNLTIDNRKINVTAFRISKKILGSSWYVFSSDGTTTLSTSADIPIDRLQKAWSLAFGRCPGVKTRF
ncbi:MAG: hypothetical protein VW226_10585 [Rhodospirillaceae bacterium]